MTKREPFDPFERRETLDLWGWVMILFSLFFLVGISILVLQEGLSERVIAAVVFGLAAVWVIFVVEYVYGFVRAQQGWRFASKHWLITLSLFFPMVRPFLVLRYLKHLKFFRRDTGSSIRVQIVISMLVFAALFIYMISLSVFAVERTAPGANILSFGNAVWWAFVTIATVGYGDLYPVTITGRVFAVVLMIGGVAIVGTASALVVSYLSERIGKSLKHPDEKVDSSTQNPT